MYIYIYIYFVRIQIDAAFVWTVNVWCFGQEIFFAFSAGFAVLFAAGSLVRRVRRDPMEVQSLILSMSRRVRYDSY